MRHGESQGNQDSSIYSTIPDHAIGLTQRGEQQAHQAGLELKTLMKNETIFFYVSPFHRSKRTCELISQAFEQKQVISVREDPRIREQEWGNFQELASRAAIVIERQKIGRFFYRFKDGESGADVYDRVSSFMDSMFREMDNHAMSEHNICIVSHGLFMRLFLMRFFRWSVEKFHTLENFDNCGYCILEKDEKTGSYYLKTELKVYPYIKPTSIYTNNKSNKLIEKNIEMSFEAEVNPNIHSDEIRHSNTSVKQTNTNKQEPKVETNQATNEQLDV
ncbi:unnamed protein product [Didymodactylos carnosus]|uniref:Phosphoglycerate mutase n=1 Tax=Didymodactylos carnosus TaxID=1234261 RepID=A0A814XWY2_9BILA|nr:unnamed protein product [Didymodactylos carnosus]CAF1221583.1 unnamed protein product [Didymodactylos carnosus]CAF3764637.1 unnamed protein product [Didymodactylos carnosus]CAF3984864.1 unnamed protein product [Didymodactylos carnosus]